MTKQRQIIVTVTYNDLGCIINAEAEARNCERWILDNLNDGNGIVYHCSCCNWLTNHNHYAYCPNCGAKMEEDDGK